MPTPEPVVAAGPDDDTTPLPVVLPAGDRPSAPVPPMPEPVDRPRGPFEPIVRPSDAAEPAASPPASVASSKLDQIMDLYLTAEAIGEDNLAKHFQQVSERQRQLIKEYFDRSASDRANS